MGRLRGRPLYQQADPACWTTLYRARLTGCPARSGGERKMDELRVPAGVLETQFAGKLTIYFPREDYLAKLREVLNYPPIEDRNDRAISVLDSVFNECCELKSMGEVASPLHWGRMLRHILKNAWPHWIDWDEMRTFELNLKRHGQHDRASVVDWIVSRAFVLTCLEHYENNPRAPLVFHHRAGLETTLVKLTRDVCKTAWQWLNQPSESRLDQGTEPKQLPAYNAPIESVTKAKPELSRLNPGVKAVAAAYALKKENQRVSLKAACERAGVCRKNVKDNYPDEAGIIRAMATPDRSVRRGTIDRRTGVMDSIDE